MKENIQSKTHLKIQEEIGNFTITIVQILSKYSTVKVQILKNSIIDR